MQGGVNVTEHDLSQKPLSDQEILKLVTKAPGEMRGPIIVFDDGTTVMGFNRDRLEKLIRNETAGEALPLVDKKGCAE